MIKIPDTLQEIYDTVATHLMKQNSKCQDGVSCMYRHDGLRCAAGALIPDDQYHKDFEQCTWTTLVENFWVENKFAVQIRNLQSIHDFVPVGEWKKTLIDFGRSRGLSLPECLTTEQSLVE